MEIKVSQLRDTLGVMKLTVPHKPHVEILKNVLVKDGRLMATDLESMVIIDMPEADESFLLPYEEVLKMLKFVPGYKILKMQAKRGNLTLSWSEGEATYPTGNIDDFPAIPDFEVKDEADIDGDTFIPALSDALAYVSTDDARPILNGVTVLFGGPIEISAGDGFRMAHIVLPLSFPAEYTTILPAAAVRTLVHVMEKTPRTPAQSDNIVDVVLSKRQLRVALDGKRGLRVLFGPTVSVIVKLVEGNPPAWLKLIPKDEPILKTQVFARDFETAVRQVRDVAEQSSGIVRLQFQDKTGTVSARGEGREVSARIPLMDVEGAPNRFAINVAYLIEYLSNKDGIVSLSWTGGTAPIAFQHRKSPKVLIMPMNADWDEPLPAAPDQPQAAVNPPEAPAEPTPEDDTPRTRKQRGKKKTK